MADLPTLFIILLLTYYSKYTIEVIINRKQRENIKDANAKLNVLRQKPQKTLEEQKKFLDIKYPKRAVSTKKWYQKITWKKVLMFILHMAGFIFGMRVWMKIFEIFDIHFPIWGTLLFAICFPIIYNYIMGKFGLNRNNDLSVFFK